jgi:very-short-patch-repair endonuclease
MKFILLEIQSRQEYLKNPKLCKFCQKPLPYEHHTVKQFCSKSCAAQFNNSNRIFNPKEDKRTKYIPCTRCGKTTLINIRTNPNKSFCPDCKEIMKQQKRTRKNTKRFKHTCASCGRDFLSSKQNTKYCSVSCGAKHMMSTGKIKSWSTRNIKSYPEKFFERVLQNNNLSYEMNKPVTFNGKTYFLDFYFADKNIDLEIDGKQHDYPDRITSDLIRDKILKKNGIKVFRIKWKSINTEDGKNEIRKNIQNFLDFYKND